MADQRREFRVGVYIFSLNRIPRHVEERDTEEWAYDLQKHIPITRGLAQRIDDWGIPFPTIIPYPYPPTRRPPTEPARYIASTPTIALNAGMPCITPKTARILHQHLQTQYLRCESHPTHIRQHFNFNHQSCLHSNNHFMPKPPICQH